MEHVWPFKIYAHLHNVTAKVVKAFLAYIALVPTALGHWFATHNTNFTLTCIYKITRVSYIATNYN